MWSLAGKKYVFNNLSYITYISNLTSTLCICFVTSNCKREYFVSKLICISYNSYVQHRDCKSNM